MGNVCALCVFTTGGDQRISTVVVDGASLCLPHYMDVLRMADYMRFDTNDRFHLRATVENLKQSAAQEQAAEL